MTGIGILDEVLAHLRGDSKTWKRIAESEILSPVGIRDTAREEYLSDLEMIKKIKKFKESLKEVV